MRRIALFVLFLVTFVPAALAQRDFSKVEIKATKVAGAVYMLEGMGGNIGVSVGDDGIVVIDDQYAPLAPKIEAALKSITDKPVRFIINTHYHGDHTGGNEHLGKSAPIIAHENVRKRLASGTSVHGHTTPPAAKGALPIVTFNERLTVHLNGEDIRAVHFAHGHTDGDAIIYFTQSNVVHMGDDFFNGIFPFVDQENGGSVKGLIGNVEKVIATLDDDAKIIPGHGALADKAALRTYLEMLKTTRGLVEKEIKAGRTLKEVQEKKVLEPWAKWATHFVTVDFWTETLFNDLKAK